MLSKAASMIAGVLIVHFYSDAFVPDAHAAWSWECTYYTDNMVQKPVYIAVGATNGPTCADKSTLTCACSSDPCEGQNAALPSNLVCAGAGDDAATSGCFKLHHTYGTPGHGAVAGRAAAEDKVTDACGPADVTKVYGNSQGLPVLVEWGLFTSGQIDNSSQPASAQECQTLCAGNADCEFFTFNDQGASGGKYAYFRGLCLLQKALACDGTKYSTMHGAIAGPKACADGVTIPDAPASGTSGGSTSSGTGDSKTGDSKTTAAPSTDSKTAASPSSTTAAETADASTGTTLSKLDLKIMAFLLALLV